MKLTAKQLKLLDTLARKPIIAPWSSVDLVKLTQMGLVSDTLALGANGRLHSSKIWTLSEDGRVFLNDKAGLYLNGRSGA